jgi:hypothetical protein
MVIPIHAVTIGGSNFTSQATKDWQRFMTTTQSIETIPIGFGCQAIKNHE